MATASFHTAAWRFQLGVLAVNGIKTAFQNQEKLNELVSYISSSAQAAYTINNTTRKTTPPTMRFISASAFFTILTLLFHMTAAIPLPEVVKPQHDTKPPGFGQKALLRYKAWHHGKFMASVMNRSRDEKLSSAATNKEKSKLGYRKDRLSEGEYLADMRENLRDAKWLEEEKGRRQEKGNAYLAKLGKAPKYGITP